MPYVQEKFQISLPEKKEAGESWASFESARRPRPMNKFNVIPSVDLDAPVVRENGGMPLCLAGCGDVSDDTNPMSLKEGFTHRSLNGYDDQYTGEHTDLFYDEARAEGSDYAGFVERNNMLDRL